MSLLSVPFDVLVLIAIYLPPDDVLHLSLTCRAFREGLNARGIWLSSMKKILSQVPLAHIDRQLDDFSTVELKWHAVTFSLSEKRWHEPNTLSQRISEPQFDRRAHSVQMLPGGHWLAIVARDALLHLRHVKSLASEVVVPLNLDNPRTILRVTTQLFLSSKHETLLLTCATFPLRTNNINIFRIDTSLPNIQLVANFHTGLSDICAYALGGDLVAYETRPGHGGLGIDSGLIHVRNIALFPDSELQEAVFSVGDPLDTACDAIALLSDHRILIARARSIALYEIPPLRLLGSQESTHLEPIWRSKFDSGGLGVSPMLWEPRLSGHKLSHGTRAAKHVRSTTFLGVDAIHMITSIEDTARDIRHHMFPLSETITASAGSVGFRRAIWSKHERAHNGHIHLATCILPDISSVNSVTDLSLRIGSILIPAARSEWVIDLSFDEGTGRICAFIGDRWVGPRRVVIIDLV